MNTRRADKQTRSRVYANFAMNMAKRRHACAAYIILRMNEQERERERVCNGLAKRTRRKAEQFRPRELAIHVLHASRSFTTQHTHTHTHERPFVRVALYVLSEI